MSLGFKRLNTKKHVPTESTLQSLMRCSLLNRCNVCGLGESRENSPVSGKLAQPRSTIRPHALLCSQINLLSSKHNAWCLLSTFPIIARGRRKYSRLCKTDFTGSSENDT